MKTQSPDLIESHHSESGQAAVVVAVFLFFVFLAVAALAIDGAITYLGRRDLQNVADAAALAACTDLANNGTAATAMITATRIITSNLGASVDYTPNIGTGTGLARGIEITPPDVRVALWRSVPTVLSQFLGRSWSTTDAKAHCNDVAGGGLLPIAVKHFDANTNIDFIANCAASCKNGDPTKPKANVPYSTDSDTYHVDPAHYVPFDVFKPKPAYEASLTNPGAIVSILDNGAKANNDASFRGFILLDIRNIASGNFESYNGVAGNVQAAKNVSSNYLFEHGYPGPIPDPGSQVAAHNGNSGGLTGKTMIDSGYKVNDIVPVIVYNGYEWGTPDYDLSFTPQISITSWYPTSLATAATYNITIQNSPASAPWQTPLNADLTFSFSDTVSLPPGMHVVLSSGASSTDLISQGLKYTASNIPYGTPWNATLQIYSDWAGTPPPTYTVQYLSGLNLSVSTSFGIDHSKSTNFGFTVNSISPADYALRAGVNSMSATIMQNKADKADLTIVTFGANSVASPCINNIPGTVTLFDSGGTPQTWSSFFDTSITPNTFNMTVQRNQDFTSQTFSMQTLPSPSVSATGNYTLRFTVGASACGPEHSLDIPLTIIPEANVPGNTQFVVVEGYALFRIASLSNSEVDAQVVSPLMFDLSSISLGMRPRLVPWNN